MFIFGQRLFGKVDRVPGLGHVATKFFHIDYVPLIPVESWLVFQQTGRTWRGVRIPLSLKSLLIAWGRMAALIAGVTGTVILVFVLINRDAELSAVAVSGVVAIIGWGLFALSALHKRITHASYNRACELAKAAKLNQQAMTALAAAYGQPPPTFGFEPVIAKPVVPIPVPATGDELQDDLVPLTEEAVTPVSPAAQVIRPTGLQETRRHG